MKRIATVIIGCCLALLLTVGNVEASEPKQTFVHFVVMPTTLPDGASAKSACKTFEAEMIMLAGGFSALGKSNGGSLHPTGVVPKDNVAYLVAAKKDVSAEIKKVVQKLFKIERVFILVWQGHMVR